MERKLAAIFSADIQDYSRLKGEDEAATIRTLMAYRGPTAIERDLAILCQAGLK
jgi:hypothetical protein